MDDRLDAKKQPKEDEEKSQLDKALSCYLDQKPTSRSLIEQKAKEKGINPLDFSQLHEELKKKGRIVNVRGDDWICSQK